VHRRATTGFGRTPLRTIELARTRRAQGCVVRSTSQSEARPPSGPSIFIAAHVVAVALLHGVVLVAGGGFASPPFPPDLTASQSTTVAARTAQASAEPVADQPTLTPPASKDITPSWTFDDEGRARFAER